MLNFKIKFENNSAVLYVVINDNIDAPIKINRYKPYPDKLNEEKMFKDFKLRADTENISYEKTDKNKIIDAIDRYKQESAVQIQILQTSDNSSDKQQIIREIINLLYTEHNMYFAYNPKIGLFNHHGGIYIEDEKEGRLKHLIRSYNPNIDDKILLEVVETIKEENFREFKDFDKQDEFVVLNDGILNLNELSISPLTNQSPAFIHTSRIAVNFKPNATCPKIDKYIETSVLAKDIFILEELFGFLLSKGYEHKYLFIMLGGIDAGKGTMGRLIERFLGGNVSNVPPQTIVDNEFAAAELFGKRANISGDVSTKIIKDTSLLKRLIGNDRIQANKKYGGMFTFRNFAKLIFDCNTMPALPDNETHLFVQKIKVIKFPYYRRKEEQNKRLYDELIVDSEMSGLLNKALKGLKRLNKEGDFSGKQTPDEMVEEYFIGSDPVIRFKKDMIDVSVTDVTVKDNILIAFKSYCDYKRILYPNSTNTFWKTLKSSLPKEIDYNRRVGSMGNQKYAIGGIRLKELHELESEEPQKTTEQLYQKETGLSTESLIEKHEQEEQEEINSLLSQHKEDEPDFDYGINIPQDFPEPILLSKEEIDRLNYDIQEIKKREQEEEDAIK